MRGEGRPVAGGDLHRSPLYVGLEGFGGLVGTPELDFVGLGLIGYQRRAPILVGKAQPSPRLLEGLGLRLPEHGVVSDFLYAARAHGAYEALVQNEPETLQLRHAVAGDQRVGVQRNGAVALVLDLVDDLEQLAVIDRDRAPEEQPLLIVPDERY